MSRGQRIILAAAVSFGALYGLAVTSGQAGSQTPQPSTPQPTVTREDRLAQQLIRERKQHAARVARVGRMLRAERRLTTLVRNPSPSNNRALARLLFTPSEFAALDRIAAGGDGIGGAPGESDWRHTVWNGGKLGYDGGNPGPNALSCGGGNYAYGIGQACPAEKMIPWAGTDAVLEIPSLQMHWMEHYARGRYGSLEAAGAHWTITRSW